MKFELVESCSCARVVCLAILHWLRDESESTREACLLLILILKVMYHCPSVASNANPFEGILLKSLHINIMFVYIFNN